MSQRWARGPRGRGGDRVPGLLLFVFLASAVPLLGQTRTLHFEHLDRSRGLSQNSVLAIAQDAEGFLWVGTQGGLNRYDGYDFEVFRNAIDDLSSLPHDWVLTLHVDRAERLWVGTEGGLALWRPASSTFDSFRHDPEDPHSLSGNQIRTIVEDSSGTLWLGMAESGVTRFDPETHASTRFVHQPGEGSGLVDDAVRALHFDSQGHLLVGTLSGLEVLDPETGLFERWRPAIENPFPDPRIRSLLEDRRGHLWIGTFGGLSHYDPELDDLRHTVHRPETEGSLGRGRVRSLWEDLRGNLWVGTDGGLSVLRPQWQERGEPRFEGFRKQASNPSSLAHDRVASIYEDRAGNVWVGTQGGGLDRWGPLAWSFGHYWSDPSEAGELSSNAVLALSAREGDIWIGTFGGGLGRLDREMGKRKRYLHDPGDPGSLQGDGVTSLLTTRSGVLWVGTFSAGLSRYDAERDRFERFQNDPSDATSLSGNAVTSLFESSRGELWVGTRGRGLNLFVDGEQGFRRFRHDPDDPTSLNNDNVTSFAEDDAERLWIGTDGGGLVRLDPQRTRFDVFGDPKGGQEPGLPLAAINTLHFSSGGTLWVGGKGGGLWRLRNLDQPVEGVEIEGFTEQDGLLDSTIYGIQEDLRGYLWLSSNEGLSRLDPERRTFKNYDTSHGLQSLEFNLGAHHRSSDGELFFGGINGFNAFFPEAIEENTHVPPVVLTSFSKLNAEVRFDRPLSEIRTIELDHRDDVVSFEVAALDFSAPHKNRYRHILEGFNEDWIDKGNNRRIDYTNLDPGGYTLWVQAANNDGLWNTEGLRLELIITPPFWLTWWFQMAALLALGSAVLLVYKIRTRTIRHNNERLTGLVQERTRDLEAAQEKLLRQERLAVLGELAGSVAHEIRNPLGVIRNSTYFLRLTQKERIDGVGHEHLELIEREIEQTNRIIAELLDYARDRPAETRPAVLQDLVTRALEMADRPANVELLRRRWDRELRVVVDPDQIARLLANLVQNAYQAMPDGGRLEVECLRHGESRVRVRIRDTGTGIDLGDQEKVFEPLFTTKANGIGLGLALSQRYARLNGGHIEFDSRPGEGTEFRLELEMAVDAGKTVEESRPEGGDAASNR